MVALCGGGERPFTDLEGVGANLIHLRGSVSQPRYRIVTSSEDCFQPHGRNGRVHALVVRPSRSELQNAPQAPVME
jgi:hypothetical protein